MATTAEVIEKATVAKQALQEYYDAKSASIDAEVVFWRDSVSSPLNSASEAGVTSALASATSILEGLGIEVE